MKGLRARGGFEIDIAWNDKRAFTGANITSMLGGSAWLTVGSEPIGANAAKTNVTGKPIKIDGGQAGRFVLLSTEAGRTYSITT